MGRFSTNDPIATHDGYQPHVGDVMWVQTCHAGVDPGCDGANQHDWSWFTITSVSSPPAPYTFTYRIGGLDSGTGNHVPIPGLGWWFGTFYGSGAGGGSFPRAMFRLQVIDPNVSTASPGGGDVARASG